MWVCPEWQLWAVRVVALVCLFFLLSVSFCTCYVLVSCLWNREIKGPASLEVDLWQMPLKMWDVFIIKDKAQKKCIIPMAKPPYMSKYCCFHTVILLRWPKVIWCCSRCDSNNGARELWVFCTTVQFGLNIMLWVFLTSLICSYCISQVKVYLNCMVSL